MIIYLAYVFSPLVVCLVLNLITDTAVNENVRLKNFYIFLCGIIMAVTICFRHPLTGSGDTLVYYDNWMIMGKVNLAELPEFLEKIDFEKGYLIYAWLFAHIFHWGQYALIISGIIYTVSVCTFVKKYSKNVVLSLLMFNCLGLFNFMVQGMRQAIAMSICLWALDFCMQKKPIKFILTVVLAGCFHGSAFVFLIVYPLSKLKLTLKSFLWFIVGVVFVAGMFSTLLDMMNTIINDDYETGNGAESGGIVAILIYGVIIVAGVLFQGKNKKCYPVFLYMTIVGMIAMIMRNMTNVIMERISYYFAFGQMVLLPTAIQNCGDEKIQKYVNIIVGLLCIGIAFHKISYSVLIPYNFYWE